MGGLWRKMKITYVTMLIGALALAAIPPFAGYYSKDAILAAAFANHSGPALFGWVCGVLGAGLTAFYISRLMILTFHGAPRGDADVHAHAHESGWTMLVPLLVLALGASFGGMLLDRPFVGAGNAAFWGSSIVPPANMVLQLSVPVPAWVADLPLLLALVGFGVAYVFYVIRPSMPVALAKAMPGAYRFLLNKWYFDELYDSVFVQPSKRLARVIWRGADDQVIDGVPTGLARWTTDFSLQMGRAQNGSLAVYSFVMLLGLLVLLSLFLVVR